MARRGRRPQREGEDRAGAGESLGRDVSDRRTVKMQKKVFKSLGWTLLFILGWLFLMAILTDSLPFGRGPEGEWSTITHEQYGFSIEYPTKWYIETYGQNGHRGLEEVKLRIWDTKLNSFKIEIWYLQAPTPTLENVLEWDNIWIERAIQNVTSQGGSGYEEIALIQATIQDQPILRRTYKLGNNMYEKVYIARSNDMIIIKMQVPDGSYNSYIDDFNRIAVSFTPMQ